MGVKLKLFALAVLGVAFALVYPTAKKNYEKHVKPHVHLVAKIYTTAKEFNILGYHIPWRYILPIIALFIAYKLYKRRKRRKEAELLAKQQSGQLYMTEEQAPKPPPTKNAVKTEEKEPKAPQASPPPTLDPKDLSLLGNRVRTFNYWPATSSANVFDLARAGFVFTGRDDVVECYKCKGTLKQWKVDDKALDAHKEFYPDCPFLKELDTSKVDSDVLTRLLNLNDVNEGVGRRLKQLQAVQSKSKSIEPANKHLGELQKRLDTTERTMHLVMKQMEAVTKCLAKTLADDPALSGDRSLAEITEGLANLKESNV
ncbi:E3 ubiquitin-protein ligase XIAP-like [Actinia tenebrosa]|uniref:E3 ubiquitin-protein ligase XIAP-like n=1 Tax=Actinia tenebrosa TaxID=6105 RepID=A0A6P8HN91_ACTTE|nr:E3 ubiquitin-protein ligase XIAP-like [Actinia tenebrosa]